MHHDKVEVFTSDGERIEFIPSPDSPMRDDYDHWINAEKRFGTLKHIEFRHKGLKIWLTHYKMNKDTTLSLHVHELSCLSLSYTIGEDIHYSIKGIPDGVSKKGFYNMIYLPYVDVEYKIKRGKTFILFGIDLTREELVSVGAPPILMPVLDSVLTGKAELLSPNYEYLILKNMIPIINSLIADMYTGKISAEYPFAYVVNTLAYNSFEAAGLYKEDHQNKDIVLLKIYIDEHLSTIKVTDLTDRFLYNRAKLRLLFLKHTGLNACDYIIEARLLKSKELVTMSNEPIKSIATAVGYENGSSFSKAFKNKFLMCPKEARGKANKLPEKTS